MDEIAIGLLNRVMIHAVKKSWKLGGVGVLYIRSDEEDGMLSKLLQRWEQGDGFRLVWKQDLENEHYYMIGAVEAGLSVNIAVANSVAVLRKSLAKQEGIRLGVAFANSPKPDSEPSFIQAAERTILKAIKEAWMAAEGAAAMEVETAAASNRTEQRKVGVYHALPGFSIGQLAVPFPIFPSEAKVADIAHFFEINRKEQGVVIADEGQPVGLLMKEELHELLAGKYGLPLYSTRPVEKIMNASPLIVDADMPIEHVSQLAMARDISHLYDVVIITAGGQLLGATTVRDILERITTLRMEAARSANPLTGLPGNEGIQLELARRSSSHKPFAVIYADLDYFKWFNDCFGFSQGDALIRFLADTLVGIKEEYGLASDFIGHIGGDDFIMVTEASYAEKVCTRLIERFDGEVKRYYGGVEVSMVEDRHGNTVEQEGVTLSLSLMLAAGGTTPSLISTLTAKLKKRAKMQKGSVYVMEDMTSCTQERNATEGIEVRRGTSSSDIAAKQPYNG